MAVKVLLFSISGPDAYAGELTVAKTKVRRSYIGLLAETMAALSRALLPVADKSAAPASPMSTDDAINTWWLNSEISIGPQAYTISKLRKTKRLLYI